MKGKFCELCSEQAFVYCESDSAFLCYSCDAKVHQANFLVARHVRRILCPKCQEFTGDMVSGTKLDLGLSRPCTSCVHDGSLSSSSSASTCVSSNTSIDANRLKKKTIRLDSDSTRCYANFDNSAAVFSKHLRPGRVKCRSVLDMKAEAIFVSWSRKLGVNSNLIVPLASTAFVLSLGGSSSTTLPFRLRLAASFWWALRLCKGKENATWKSLKDVEMLSHVPCKLILAAETKVARVLRDMKKRESSDMEEGWAESCS